MSLLLYCRAGFEGECAAEIQDHALAHAVAGYVRAKSGSGWLVFETLTPADALRLYEAVALRELIFARQWFVVVAMLEDLLPTDRVGPLVEAMRRMPSPLEEVWLETPDTNEGKELSSLARALSKPLDVGLRRQGLLNAQSGSGWRAHVCVLASNRAYVGYARIANSSRWPGGVARLKFPRAAPSRSTLKLDEALLEFFSADERAKVLQPGMRAVDLGAAPGGWTWQLVRRHIAVIAVDNGSMDAALLDSGLVEHVRADGFRYRPVKPVHWMVCDIVEQPIRIARLAAQWLAQGWCTHSIFNLKLPMKKRYQEVQLCLSEIRETLSAAGIPHRLLVKQLYHDREEVTVYLAAGGRR